jgi:predicted tellurium resistance membrane protein TerC
MNIFSFEVVASLVSLTLLEVVLGVDNVVFLAILSQRLPNAQASVARRLGLLIALGMRLGLLITLSWLAGLVAPLFTLAGRAFCGRDLVLLAGGLFLIGKATFEIQAKLESGDTDHLPRPGQRAATLGSTVVQIAFVDVVLSIDSVITAVGMAPRLWVMVAAMVLAMAMMIVAADQTTAFIQRHPSMKILGLAFLILIGVMLVGDAMGHHLPRGYVYFAMGFSLAVEFINIRVRDRDKSAHKLDVLDEPITQPERKGAAGK